VYEDLRVTWGSSFASSLRERVEVEVEAHRNRTTARRQNGSQLARCGERDRDRVGTRFSDRLYGSLRET
jgi:hypothetical protein